MNLELEANSSDFSNDPKDPARFLAIAFILVLNCA